MPFVKNKSLILNQKLYVLESFPFEIIADEKRELIKQLGMEDLDERDTSDLPLAARAVCSLIKTFIYLEF